MVNIDPSSGNIFSSAAGGANEVWKILKKEEKKGSKSSIIKALQQYNIAHQKFKEELAKGFSEETGMKVSPESDIVNNMIFGLSLGKIFENIDGKETVHPELKPFLQLYDSESPQAKEAVANHLSKGSKQKVSPNDELVNKDIDEISVRSVENPDLLLS